MMTTMQKAGLLIGSIYHELRLGTKHFDKLKPDVEVRDLKEIVMLLVDGNLVVEPTQERQHIFRGYIKERADNH